MNEALSGKADKDWVEKELAKYLLLTGGKISGDLEVTGTLKIGDAVLSYAGGRLHVSSSVTSDGDFVAFGDEEGSTGSGGLDVARMWEELEADDSSKVIDVSHIPGSVVLQDELVEILDDYPLTTEMNEALSGKADKDTTLAGYGITDAYTKTQIDEELAKYVTIAGNQDITGVKTFVNGIKIGSISLSVVDGRLHVSSTVTSDGDFVAFGDEDGASGSGGLDIARLWQELEADDSSKVIDASHIPSITKAKISDFPTKWAWADISGKPSTFAPSAHSHAISDVTGLQGALDSKWVWNESQVKAVKVNSAASADNADTLDGVHANGLLTALTSSATTNLSLTVGGKSLSVAGFYAKFADQLRTARKINGTSFNGAHEITTEKWGMARLVSIKDYTQDNAGATKSVDGQESFSLLLPQSIKVKTLDVDGVTLSVIDGRLHISATATSAGDFVAYGNDEGGAGVLDVDKLWQELGGSESSKVIDLSHIPSIPTSKITGLSDYVWNILVTPGTLSGPKIDASHLPPLSDLSGNLDSSRITGLDNALSGYVSSVTTSGEGNAVTGYAKSGNTLTLKKDLTFLTSVPKATSSAYGGIKIGYPESGKNYPVELDSSGRAYVSVPWVNTTYSLSSFGITATAAEINKLDGVGTLLHSGNYTSYTYPTTVAKISDLHSSWDALLKVAPSVYVTRWPTAAEVGALTQGTADGRYAYKDGSNASGTWPISISGNATTADISNYLFLNPNNGTHASQNDAVPANGRFAIYDVNATTTAGGSDGYIMAFRWPSGNWVTQVFLEADNTGIMALRHRNNSNVWTDWYRILHIGNIGSYALTPSNYTSYLDSRYVKKAGDTMTGPLTITTSSDDILIFNDTEGEKYFRIKAKANGTDWGGLVLDGRSSVQNLYLGTTSAGYKVWHSGNDGSGSGLDADLLDGYHQSSFLRSRPANNVDFNTVTESGVYRLSNTTSNGASNGPSGNDWGNMLVLRGGGDTIAQLAFGYTSSDRPMFRQGNPPDVGGGGSWTQWFTLATTLDNVASATKLQTSRTLWGQSFNGTRNVSGAMTGVGSITGATFSISGSVGQMLLYNNTSKNDKRLTLYPQSNYAAIYNITADGNGISDLVLGNNSNALYYDASADRWGIGTTSPAYKLDVAGEIRATSGITIGSTDDYGWYINGVRITAGWGTARGVNVGSLLVSNAWADYTKVPTNGIYSKGDIITGGRLFIPSSEGNDKYYIRIE